MIEEMNVTQITALTKDTGERIVRLWGNGYKVQLRRQTGTYLASVDGKGRAAGGMGETPEEALGDALDYLGRMERQGI